MIGDLVLYNGEEGVICAVDPLVMRVCQFHSYVAIRGEYTTITPGYDLSACMRPEVHDRIRLYFSQGCIYENNLPTIQP